MFSWFKRHTVAELVADLTNTADKLEHLAEEKRREAKQIDIEVDQLLLERSRIDDEIDRALRVSDNLRDLLE